MTLVKFKRKPIEPGFNNFVDDLFNQFPAFFGNDFNKSENRMTIPVNVKETEKSYRLEVVAPGFDKNDFKIELDKDLLTISAEKKDEVMEENQQFLRREYSHGTFKRSFTLDEKIDATKIDATYINGVLVLNLPKKETVKAPATAIAIK